MPGDLIPGMRLNHLSLEAKFRQTADEVITERTRVWDVENLLQTPGSGIVWLNFYSKIIQNRIL